MKILRIITRLNIGGPAIHAILLTQGLGFKTQLVTGSIGEGEGDMSYLAQEKGVRPILIPELGRNIRWDDDIAAFFKLYRLIKREKPYIIHTHMAKAGTLGRLAGVIAKVPIRIHTFHGHVFQGYFNPLATKLFIIIEKVLARFCQRLVTISPTQYHQLCYDYKIAPRDRFVLIPLGFDLTPFLNSESQAGKLREELGIPPKTYLIGIIGRLTPVKNHRLFFRAAWEVLKREPEVKFLVVGGGELLKELNAFVKKLGIEEKVIFLGWRRDMDLIYADLDVVVLTSINEGTPVTLIEAMASAKPVVATRVGGVPDVVKDGVTGILVPPEDVIGLTQGILKLLEDKKLREDLGRAGREFVRERFSKDRLIRDMENLYTTILVKDYRGKS